MKKLHLIKLLWPLLLIQSCIATSCQEYTIHYGSDGLNKLKHKIGLKTLQDQLLKNETITCYEADVARFREARKMLRNEVKGNYTFFVKNAFCCYDEDGKVLDDDFKESFGKNMSSYILLVKKENLKAFLKENKSRIIDTKEYTHDRFDGILYLSDYLGESNLKNSNLEESNRDFYLFIFFVIAILVCTITYFNNEESDIETFAK